LTFYRLLMEVASPHWK